MDANRVSVVAPPALPWLRPVLVIALTFLLLWLVIVRGYADYLARPAPARSLSFNADQPEALTHLASDALEQGDLVGAREYAERVATNFPFEGRALRVLGAIEERLGKIDRAKMLMLAAAHAAPRDTATQYWLALQALTAQDLDLALQRMDRVLRFQPDTVRQMFPLLGTIAANPFGARKLAPMLAAEPAWRREFLSRFLREAQIKAVLNIERLLVANGGQLTVEESKTLTDRLQSAKDWARLAARLEASVGIALNQLRDGDFEGQAQEPMAGWEVEKVAGADVVFGQRTEAQNSAMRVVFHDRRVPFAHVRQFLLLSPGSYSLTGQRKLVDLDTPRGLVWTVRCEGQKGQLLGQTESLRGSSSWSGLDLQFSVPEADCRGQWLSLEVAARIAAEQQLSGEAWFTGFKLETVRSDVVDDPATSSAQ